MRFKLDENFDVRLVPLLAQGGHDVDTVRDEHLSGSPDETIYETCRRTARTLITLDLDFASPFRFPPEGTEGIVVIRPPRAILPVIKATLESVLAELTGPTRAGVCGGRRPDRGESRCREGEEG
jgi:predicted nuclease of predicted toxin-antitoxin system